MTSSNPNKKLAPLHSLKSDFDIIKNHIRLPDPTSDSYTHITRRVVGHKRFNPINNNSGAIDTYELTISGVSLVFEEDSDLHPLHKTWKGHNNLEKVNLYADEVIIRSPLRLRSSNVTIYARSLVFENNGCIDTTSAPYQVTESNKPEAEHGSHAGNIALHVKHINAAGDIPRLIAKGSNGQDAMQGSAGTKGTPVTGIWNGKFHRDMFWFDPELDLDWSGHMGTLEGHSALYVEIIKTMGMSSGWSGGSNGHEVPKYEITEKVDSFGNADGWPGDGENPERKPGAPGEPGNGGDIYLPAKMSLEAGLYDVTGGTAGNKADDIPAALAGTPVKSCHVKAYFKPSGGVQTNVDRLEMTKTNISKPGEAATAPSAKQEKGHNGNITRIDDSNAGFWLYPAAVMAFVEFAKDTYISERPDIILPLLQEYRSALGELPDSDVDAITYNALNAEITGMIRQIHGKYDYFGNPAGWVPMLSFESNLRLYKNEIDASARQLFLSYWIEKNQTNADNMISGLNFTLSQLNSETRAAIADYNAALSSLDTTDIAYRNLVKDIDSRLIELGNKEAELQKKAKKELQVEHIIRGSAKLLGGVLQMIPAGQPALGAVGSVVSVLGDFDPDEPFDSVKSLGSELWGTSLVQKKLLPAAKNSAQSFLKIKTEGKGEPSKFDQEKAKKELGEAVKKAMNEEKAVKEQVSTALGNFTVPEDELDEALARAVADCPEYAEISEKIADLNDNKRHLSQQLQSCMHVLDTATNTIINNALASISIQEQLSSAVEGLNHEARRYASEMGRRARARLVRYQYYIVKSYNYNMLQPREEVDYRASYMLKEFAKLLGSSKDGSLTDQQYESIKGVFERELNDIIEELIDSLTLNIRPPNLTISVSLSPRQITRLNRDGHLDINLMEMGYLFPTDDDIRIVDIKTTAVDLLAVPKGKAVNVRLEYRHSGTSTLRSHGRQFLFRTGDYRLPSGNKDQPDSSYRNNKMLWGTNIKVNIKGEQEPDPIVPSPTTQSLLHYLLQNQKGGDKSTRESLEYYRPSAWADISIRRTAAPQPFKGDLENLNLEVTYDYLSAADTVYSIYIATPGGAMPIIGCDTPDMNQRSEGRGTFLRTYDSNQVSTVVFNAPSTFGNFTFMGWKILADVVAPNPDASLPLTPLMTPDGTGTFLDISERFTSKDNDDYAVNNLWTQGLITTQKLSLEVNRHYSVLAVYLPLTTIKGGGVNK